MQTRKRKYQSPVHKARKQARTTVVAKRQPLPQEALVDVFTFLNRWSLDSVQQSCRRFSRVVQAQMWMVCLRTVIFAKIKDSYDRKYTAVVRAEVDQRIGSNGEKLLSVREVQYELELEHVILRRFLNAIRSSCVAEKLHFDLHGPPATLEPLRSVSVIGLLKFNEHRFTQGSDIRTFLGAFASVDQISVMTSRGLSDLFLRYCLSKRIRAIYNVATKCKRVSEEGVIHFCFGGTPFTKPRVLNIEGPTMTSRFLHRMIQAHDACTHDGAFYLVVTRFLKKLPRQELNEYAANRTASNRYSFTSVNGNVLRIDISTFSEKIVVRRNCDGDYSLEY